MMTVLQWRALEIYYKNIRYFRKKKNSTLFFIGDYENRPSNRLGATTEAQLKKLKPWLWAVNCLNKD